MTAPNLQIYKPPSGMTPLTDEAWRRWYVNVVWPIIGAGVGDSGPQGTFPQLQVGDASFTTENAQQELLTTNQGLYVNYYSSIENIIYGFACNVHHSGSGAFTVGAQINAWGEVGSTGDVFGVACTALAQPFSGTRDLIALEPDVVNQSSTSIGAKWGINSVFKNRFDGAAATTAGLGSNLYNYFSAGLVFTSQVRGTDTAQCGWNVGVQFLDQCIDNATSPAWSASVTYAAGATVTSGGLVWKAVTSSLNVAPGVGVAQWVQYSFDANTRGVGIDFTPLGTTAMNRLWSAIRLRNTMAVHWEETGVIATYYDAANTRHVLSANWNGAIYVRNLQVDVTNGNLWVQNGITANGGGAAPTFGTIGATGPAVAAQRGWYKIIDSTTGNPFWVPVWQ